MIVNKAGALLYMIIIISLHKSLKVLKGLVEQLIIVIMAAHQVV